MYKNGISEGRANNLLEPKCRKRLKPPLYFVSLLILYIKKLEHSSQCDQGVDLLQYPYTAKHLLLHKNPLLGFLDTSVKTIQPLLVQSLENP